MRAEGRRRHFWRKAAIIFAATVIAGGVGIALVNPRLTRYVESDAFRAELEKQTAKGLHFPAGTYLPIRRTGFLSAASDGFRAQDGRKALTTMDAHAITARFNPLGVFLRRWQLDAVHIAGGEVGIQTYEPKPEPSPAKPWYHVFLPDRVYLRRVWSEPADVTWKLRNEKGGFFGTRLLITPHGRDFEYRATGGTMKGPLIPDLPLRHTHLLITKTLLTLYKLDLAAGPESDGFIQAEGTAGTRDDKSVDFKITFGEAAGGRLVARELGRSRRRPGRGRGALEGGEPEARKVARAGLASGRGRTRAGPAISREAPFHHWQEIDRTIGAERMLGGGGLE